MDLFGDNWLTQHILTMLIIVPIAGAALVFSRIDGDAVSSRRIALGVSLLTLLLGVIALGQFNLTKADLTSCKLIERHTWIGEPEQILIGKSDRTWSDAAQLKIEYHVGVDGISLPLILLTVFLTPLAIWGSFTAIQDRAREFYALLLLLHAAMIGVFCSRDLLLFYMFFEFTLVPLYFLIGIWGGSMRQKAANMFFIYTLAGSMLTFAGVLYLGWLASHLPGVSGQPRLFTFDLDVLYRLAYSELLPASTQAILFFAFFAGFAIKVPLFPMHTWLPLAHTEAPTAGSVILAGVLLKLGTYGFLRLSLPMLPFASIQFAPFIGVLAVVGIIYGALAAWVQSDFKRLVAYSSVSHLGYCLLGMFSLSNDGVVGSLMYMLNHGLSTGALFLVVGMIYERYHTRELSQIGGLAKKMPILAFFLVVFTFASVGLPGLNGFVSEFLVLLGTFGSRELGVPYAAFGALGIILSAVYMLHMARGILFGPVREPGHGADDSQGLTQDLTPREIGILALLALACLLLGVCPGSTLRMMNADMGKAVLEPIVDARMKIQQTASATAASHQWADASMSMTGEAR